MMIAALPAGATTDAARSLSASADNSEGRILDTNGHLWVYMHPGAGAEVAMPPQRDAVENSRPGPSTTLFDGTAQVRRGFEHNRASGSLADGTAEAMTTTEDLFVHLEPLGLTISAESIRSVSRTTCEEQTAADAFTGTAIGELRVNDELVALQDTPNGPGQRFETPDGLHYVEIQTLKVQRHAETNGWTTTALTIRAGNVIPLVVTKPDKIPVTHELEFGITSSTVECAA